MSESATPPGTPDITGLVVGRFDPPHLGHSYLLDAALDRCDRVAVYVNSGPATPRPDTCGRPGWPASTRTRS